LLDVDMPLIRYRVGDRIAIGDESRLCPCGRALPLLDSVDGRCDDLLQTRDGRLVGRLDPVFKAGLGVREAQVIQESLDRIRVLLVPGEGFGAPDEVAIRRAVRDRLGDVRVSLECVAAIPRSRNGKFRAVISRVSPKPEVEEAPLKQAAATGLPMSKISVIVPCRNECGHIDRFLADLWSQQLPRGRELEVIVADGGSDDGSRDVLRRAAERRPNVTVIDNPRRIVSTGLNEAIRVSSGDVIIRMDVHTRYAPDYLAQSLAALSETGADCVGGPWVPLGVNHVSNAVALVFDSWFVSGGGRAHARAYDGPSDTVYLGAWRRDAFWSFGFFDESLVRSQDNELNFRIRRLGGIVWQSSRIRSLYQPRTTLSSLWRQYAQYGYWKVKVLQKHGRPATIRQLAPGLLVGLSIALLAASAVDATAGRALLFLLGSYALVSAAASLIACRRPRHWRYLPVTPAVFAAFHFGFGYGFLRGLVDFFLLRRGGRAGFSLLTRNRSKPPAKSAANTA
jgi:glycosyltransferase involved in cell wall biosynthesis